MKSLFEISLSADPFSRRIGQDEATVDTGILPEPEDNSGLEDFLKDLVRTGKDIYSGYSDAEKRKKAAEAAAKAAAQTATAAAPQPAKIFGIPVTYVVIGTVGLAAAAILFSMKK